MAVGPRHFAALFATTWDEHLLQRLQMPVRLMQVSASLVWARCACDQLAPALLQAQRVTLGGAGHLDLMTRHTVARWMLMHLDPNLAAQQAAAVQA